MAEIHLDSLRHRMIENSKPLEHAIAEGQRADFKLVSDNSEPDSGAGSTARTPETDVSGLATAP
jgi:hypothetical protein